jgi:hypothetical protein
MLSSHQQPQQQEQQNQSPPTLKSEESLYHLNLNGNSKKKERVSSACSNCRKSKLKYFKKRKDHTCCDENRPCSRCIKLGKQDTCSDVISKKRGPKPKTSRQEGKPSAKKQKLDHGKDLKITPKIMSIPDIKVEEENVSQTTTTTTEISNFNPNLLETQKSTPYDDEIEDPLNLDLGFFSFF